MKSIFGNVPYTLLETHDIFFRCGCSHEKVERALLSFDQNEIRDMIDKDDGAKVSCEFCRQVYQFDAAELAALTGMDVVTEPNCRS
jgi:molecular chaperone Hsp33